MYRPTNQNAFREQLVVDISKLKFTEQFRWRNMYVDGQLPWFVRTLLVLHFVIRNV